MNEGCWFEDLYEALLSPFLISFWLSAYKFSLSLSHWLFVSVGDHNDYWVNRRSGFNCLWLIQVIMISNSGFNSHCGCVRIWDSQPSIASWRCQSSCGDTQREKTVLHLLYIRGLNAYCTFSLFSWLIKIYCSSFDGNLKFQKYCALHTLM